jgi:hypothetical protein
MIVGGGFLMALCSLLMKEVMFAVDILFGGVGLIESFGLMLLNSSSIEEIFGKQDL